MAKPRVESFFREELKFSLLILEFALYWGLAFFINFIIHELLGHVILAVAFGLPIEEVGLMFPLGAWVTLGGNLATFPLLPLYGLFVIGISVTLVTAYILRQVQFFLLKRRTFENVRWAQRIFGTQVAMLSFSALYSSFPIWAIVVGLDPLSWQVSPVSANDMSTFINIAVFQQQDLIWTLLGILTAIVLVYISFKFLIGGIRDLSKGLAPSGENEGKVVERRDGKRYRIFFDKEKEKRKEKRERRTGIILMVIFLVGGVVVGFFLLEWVSLYLYQEVAEGFLWVIAVWFLLCVSLAVITSLLMRHFGNSMVKKYPT